MIQSDAAGEPPAFSILDGGSPGFGDDITLVVPEGFEAGVDDAVTRMDRVLRSGPVGGDAVSFDVSMPEPERGLLSAIGALGKDNVSFALEGAAPRELEAGTKISRFLGRILERVDLATSVQTQLDGRPIAATAVGLMGDFTCTLAAVIGPSELEAHVKSVEAELRIRRAWVRLVLSTLQMAGKVAAAVGVGNPLVALPAVWKFVRGVLAERTQLERAV